MHRPALLAIGTLALSSAACGGEPAEATRVPTRDSAGVTIVENVRPQWGESDAWRLSAEPEVKIGTFEGDPVYELFQVSAAVRLSDSRIVIANRGTHELRYYDASGVHLTSVGRQGGGPGEFQMLGFAGALPGDSVMTYDFQHRRISIFDPSGDHIRDIDVGSADQLLFIFPAGRLRDGTYLAQAPSRRIGPGMLDRPTGRQRDTILVLHLDSAGVATDTIGAFPNILMETSRVQMGDRSFPMPLAVPFSPITTVAVGAERVYIGDSETYEVRVYDASGRLSRLVRKEHERRPVTEADIAADQERRAEMFESQDNPFVDQMRDVYEDMTYPETMPAYGQAVLDAQENLWIAAVREPEADTARWIVFDTEGRMLGEVMMPMDLRVTDIGADYVIGTMSDELEVESVYLYRLIKPGG